MSKRKKFDKLKKRKNNRSITEKPENKQRGHMAMKTKNKNSRNSSKIRENEE